MSAVAIYDEVARVEALIGSPEGKGKLTVLKAYHRKLCRQYVAALKAEARA